MYEIKFGSFVITGDININNFLFIFFKVPVGKDSKSILITIPQTIMNKVQLNLNVHSVLNSFEGETQVEQVEPLPVFVM